MSTVRAFASGRPRQDRDGVATVYRQGQPIAFEIATVTPADAAEWLTKNTRNRPLSEKTAKKYSRSMAEGRWRFNGEPVIFAAGGWLMNGQTRLTACVRSGVAFETLVVRGVPDDTFHSMDTGRPRAAADVLALTGLSQTTRTAAAARWWLRYTSGQVVRCDTAWENSEVLEVVEAHPGLVGWVSRCKKTEGLYASSLTGFLFYLFEGIDPEAAEAFFEDYVSGANLPADDPVYLLRKRLIDNRVAKTRLPSHEVAAVFIKAWNHRRDRQRIKFLRWRSIGPTAEPFPTAK